MKKYDRYLDSYTDSFLNELIGRQIIKEVENPASSNVKAYKLLVQDESNTSNQATLPPGLINQNAKEKNVIQSFYDFRNITSIVYRDIFEEGKTGQVHLSDMVDRFAREGVFSQSWTKIPLLRKFLDKADDLLPNEEVKRDVIKMIDENKVSFNKLVIDILKFHIGDSIKSYDRDLIVDKNSARDAASNSDYTVSNQSSECKLLVEVKFRKKSYSTKEFIQQCIDLLNRSANTGNQNEKILLVVYTYGNLSELERDKFKFQINMQENFQSNIDSIFFLPIGINHFDIAKNQLAQTLVTVFNRKAKSFRFYSQPVKTDSPEIDDHYYDKILDLEKFRYEISFKANSTIDHWRFGIKFSKDLIFPSKETRHPIGYPIFHVTKNNESKQLLYTFYNPENVNVEKPTTISNYSGENLIIRLNPANNVVLIDVVDSAGKSILESLVMLADYKYCMVFAWADASNMFDFDSEIFEIQLKGT